MEGIVINKKPRLRNPTLIVAWPGMGEVAFKAASHLVEKLKAEEFAEIAPGEFFYLTGSIIQEGLLTLTELPLSKFYFWKNKEGEADVIIFISNTQPDLIKAESYSKKIIYIAKSFKVKKIISFAAMPAPIDHTQAPKVWAAATKNELNNELRKFNLNILNAGQVSGMNGLFLGFAKREGIDGFCLLGEIPLYTIQVENPKASFAVLSVLAKILKIKLDLSNLIDQAQIMDNEINKLLEYLKIGPQAASPIGEEEIEKIKKSLGQLTKLPVSVKEKIEKLFEEAKNDLSKASELKTELDRWNTYMEFEDRFLDLFKKKEKGN